MPVESREQTSLISESREGPDGMDSSGLQERHRVSQAKIP